MQKKHFTLRLIETMKAFFYFYQLSMGKMGNIFGYHFWLHLYKTELARYFPLLQIAIFITTKDLYKKHSREEN